MENLFLALEALADPLRLGMLFLGVILGLTIGVIPGLGGIFGLTILVPLTYSLDPVAAIALLVGMASVTTTSDTIPAVLLGVPGTVGAAATVVDGHEMAKNGQAAEALGAAYFSSMVGGIFGALVLALALPIMRPLVLFLNYGDLLAITIFGLTLVAILSGKSQLRGLIAAVFGVQVSLLGLDPYESAERWTFGNIYFWDGLPVAIVFLGLFGLPELGSILSRGSIQSAEITAVRGGLGRGVIAAIRNWRLVIKSSAIGSFLGAVPGIGVTVIEWIAYGVATKNRGAGPAFGAGNIRGVIGPESANNSKEGGALLPTIAFGIPGSATMAILLGAFAIHGLAPGPSMLDTNAPILIALILSVAFANIIGATICLGLTPTLAKISTIRSEILVPVALTFIVVGAYQTHKDIMDIAVLLVFGILGATMKHVGWSRPAFVLGFVLGPNLERFFAITYQISGWNWLSQPVVLVILALAAASLIRGQKSWKQAKLKNAASPHLRMAVFTKGDKSLAIVIALTSAWMVFDLLKAPMATKLFPSIVGGVSVGLVILLLALELLRGPDPSSKKSWAEGWRSDRSLMLTALSLSIILILFGHLAGPAIFGFFALYSVGRITLWKSILIATATTTILFLVFDVLASQSWPKPLIISLYEVFT